MCTEVLLHCQFLLWIMPDLSGCGTCHPQGCKIYLMPYAYFPYCLLTFWIVPVYNLTRNHIPCYACNSFEMASDTQGSVELKQEPPQRIQIYPTPSNEVPPFWRRLCPSPLSVSHFTNTFLIACMDAQTLVCTIPFAITASFSVAVKYEREAKKYWDNFYKRHQDRVDLIRFSWLFKVIMEKRETIFNLVTWHVDIYSPCSLGKLSFL